MAYESAPPITSSIAVFAAWLMWTCLTQTPDNQLSPFLKLVFTSKLVLEQLLNASGIVFAPGLLDAFQSAVPPTISYFKTLPLHTSKKWAVYLLVLEKRKQRPRIYIGTGTDKRSGVATRLGQYRRGENYSRFVDLSVKDGYKITYTGLLCWAPLSTASQRFKLHAQLLLLEGVLSLCFWAMKSRTSDYGVAHLTPWGLDAFEYDGCCGHVCLREQMKETRLNMSDEQIDAAEKERKLRNSRRDAIVRGPERTARDCKRMRDKALAQKRFFCEPCQVKFGAANQLRNHKKLASHLDKVNGVVRVVKNPRAKQRGQENIEKKRYYCSLCKYAASTQQKLTAHLNTDSHKNAVKDSKSGLELD